MQEKLEKNSLFQKRQKTLTSYKAFPLPLEPLFSLSCLGNEVEIYEN